MSDPYLGEIRMFGGNFAPLNWAFCDGQSLSIAQNDALFALIGTTYGGDGVTTFNLPDLRGRIPLHLGTNSGTTYVQGQSAGVENVSLTANQIPSHGHSLVATTDIANSNQPSGNMLANASVNAYAPAQATAQLDGQSIGVTGGQPHNNLMPYLCINFIISLSGVFPSQG